MQDTRTTCRSLAINYVRWSYRITCKRAVCRLYFAVPLGFLLINLQRGWRSGDVVGYNLLCVKTSRERRQISKSGERGIRLNEADAVSSSKGLDTLLDFNTIEVIVSSGSPLAAEATLRDWIEMGRGPLTSAVIRCRSNKRPTPRSWPRWSRCRRRSTSTLLSRW